MDPGEAFPASLPRSQGWHLWASYLGLSSGLEAGAAAEAVAAWAAAVARGGEAALGEAAAGGWAEAGSSGVVAWLVHTGACSMGVLTRRTEKDNRSRTPLCWGGGCRRGRLGGRYQPYCQQSRIFQKSCPQAQGKNTPTQDPKTEGLRPQGDHSNVRSIFKPREIPLPPIFVYFLICLSQRVL